MNTNFNVNLFYESIIMLISKIYTVEPQLSEHPVIRLFGQCVHSTSLNKLS